MKKFTIILLFMGFLFHTVSAKKYGVERVDSLIIELNKISKDNIEKIASLQMQIGITYHFLSNYEEALEYYFNTLNIFLATGNKKECANLYQIIGVSYEYQSNYDNSLKYYLKSLDINEEIENKRGVADILNNIGLFYSKQLNMESALDFLYKSLKIHKELNNKKGIAYVYGNIGDIYNTQSKYNKALEYYLKTLNISKEIDDKQSISTALLHIGHNYSCQYQYTSALDYYHKALDIAIAEKNKKGIAENHSHLGLLFYNLCQDSILSKIKEKNNLINLDKSKKLNRSIEYLIKAIVTYKEIGALNELQKYSKHLANAYSERNDYINALKYYKEHITLKDSIFSLETQTKIANLEAKRENEIKQKEIEMLKKENEYKTNLSYYLYAVSALILLVLLVLFYFYRNKKKTNFRLKEKNTQISQAHQHITDSINYAQKIQTAMLPWDDTIRKLVKDYFIIYQPKDIISGDFYWVAEVNNSRYFACVDCTGHGVPGAFMSIIGNDLLDQIIKERKISDPATILEEMNKGVRTALSQKDTIGSQQDGMDIALIKVSGKILEFSGARRPLWYQKDGKIEEIKGNKKSIGGRLKRKPIDFITKSIEIKEDTVLYLFSDGIIDQNNVQNEMFGTKRFLSIIEENSTETMEKQKEIIEKEIIGFASGEEHRDDITIFAIKL